MDALTDSDRDPDHVHMKPQPKGGISDQPCAVM